MWSLDDTIAAVSTPIGEGGIGIVRLSGSLARAILRRVFRPAAKGALDPESHRLYYGHVVDPETSGTVDEALAVWMSGNTNPKDLALGLVAGLVPVLARWANPNDVTFGNKK